MSDTPKCIWPGKSGKKYTYQIFTIDTTFKEEAGNYIFCKRNANDNWTPQYIGQTKSLSDRLDDHDKEACAKRHGATHIHAHLNSQEAARLAEEKDLILNFQPPCNEQ